MKNHLDVVHTGTLGDEGRTRMSFDQDSLAHLMSVLTDLYSDPGKAVVREYSTNARDSHIEAGNAHLPIKVTSPTYLNPTLVIKDFGVGMDQHDIEATYSKYGASTKRATNDLQGMLGLGSKSGLAYTSQFTVVAIKNGTKTTALVTREGDGAGTIQIVSTAFISEPNGVEIRIPVASVSLINDNIHEFFQYWERGTVLVDGEEPYSIWTDPKALHLDPDVCLSLNPYSDMVVMGGVAYPIPTLLKIGSQTARNLHVVGRVPIGTINFVPNRERLQMNRRTVDTINELEEFVKRAATVSVQRIIDAAPTHAAALRLGLAARPITPYWRMSYKGDKLPTHLPKQVQGTVGRVIKPKAPNSDFIKDKADEVSLRFDKDPNDLEYVYAWVTNYVWRSPTKIDKARVRVAVASELGFNILDPVQAEKYYAEYPQNRKIFIMCGGDFEHKWVDGPVFDWQWIKKHTPLPSDKVALKRPTPPWFKMLNHESAVVGGPDDFGSFEVICWIDADKAKHNLYVKRLINGYYKVNDYKFNGVEHRKCVVAVVPKRYVKKWNATHPEIANYFDAWHNLFTAAKFKHREALVFFDHHDRNSDQSTYLIDRICKGIKLFNATEDQYLDPAFKPLCDMALALHKGGGFSQMREWFREVNEMRHYLNSYSMRVVGPPSVFRSLDIDPSEYHDLEKVKLVIQDRYPLFTAEGDLLHQLKYVNAVYKVYYEKSEQTKKAAKP